MKKYYCLAFFVLLSACKNESKGLKVELADYYNMTTIVEELEKNGVSCEAINEELYCDSSDIDTVNRIIQSVSLDLFPAERSIYLGMPGLHEAVIEQLDNSSLPYQLRDRQGETWIIFEEKDKQLINKIISERRHALRQAMQYQ